MAENFLNRFTQRLKESYRYVKVNVRNLLLKQKEYHQKTVFVDGKVTQVVNTDLIEEVVTDTWIFDLPQTIPIAKSATYFYLEDQTVGRPKLTFFYESLSTVNPRWSDITLCLYH